ncbi:MULTISPECIES: ABC transporter substrate-binding protein [Anaerolinea]|uniref:substrate-binding periplasmic protein n=1 Tax=Anaerolinea TaxID=233189 RepID=UPI002619C3DD|nr:transporter substrate-binding domain-containing protein [Anaerolinea thermophila]
MKRFSIWMFVVLVMGMILSACASAGGAASGATPTAAQGSVQTGCLGSAETALVDLQCRKITVAVENAYMPFNYILVATGEPGGWDYDALREICTRLHCEPVFVEAAWDGMIQAVADKQYDMAADGITITEDRKQIVDFSVGYISINQRLLVRKGENRFTSIEDFARNEALVLGTQINTTNYETAKKYLPESRIKGFEQFAFAVQALISGDVDAVIIDETAGQGYRGENAEKLELIGPSISSDELGFVFPKGSDLVEPFNKAIEAMIADGTLERLNQKYFGPEFKLTESDVK